MNSKPLLVGLITSEIFNQMNAYSSDLDCCDWFEFRADTFDNESAALLALKELQKIKKNRPLLLTSRLNRDGGLLENHLAKSRLDFFLVATKLELVDYVDIELEEPDFMSEFIEQKTDKVKVIASHHNFQSGHTLSEMNFFAAKAQTLGADSLKLALMFQNEKEEKDLYEFIQSELPIKLIAAFGMGKLGKASRVLGPLLGAPLTYGYAGGKEAAPGQWPLKELRKTLDMFADMDLSLDQLLNAF